MLRGSLLPFHVYTAMHRQSLNKNRDLIIASALGLISLFTMLIAYNNVLALDSHSLHTIQVPLLSGQYSYKIGRNGRCSGYLELKVSETKGTLLQFNGFIYAADTHGAISPATITGQAQLDSLGQLTQSEAQVSGSGVMLQIKSKEVQPVRVSLDLQVNHKYSEKNFSLPGPIIMRKLTSITSSFEQGKNSYYSLGMLKIMQGLAAFAGISMLSTHTAPTNCAPDEIAPVALQEVLSLLDTTNNGLSHQEKGNRI